MEFSPSLGVVEPSGPAPIDRRWLESKIGGQPGWLSPGCIPRPEDLECAKCKNALMFFLQLYAPSSTQNEDDKRFHRMLYIFGCWTCGSDVRLIRAHLPRINSWLPAQLPQVGEDFVEPDEALEEIKLRCCPVCLLPSHQGAEHMRCLNAKRHGSALSTFPESFIEIITEAEPFETKEEDIEARLARALQTGPVITELLEGEEGGHSSEDDDDDAPAGTCADPENDIFLQRYLDYCHTHPQHIVRYGAREPLWFSYKRRMRADPPPCEHCGARRKFEFQIQSTFPHFVKQNANLELAFGILAAFTCSEDCDTEGSYKFDYLFRQPDTTLDMQSYKQL